MRATFVICSCHKNISIQSKRSEMKNHPLCLGNISEDFLGNNMKTKD